MERIEFNNKIIDNIIKELQELKENKVPISIDWTPSWIGEMELCDGTMYAKKNLNINITWEQLYTKNGNIIGDTYKPYKKRKG